MRSYKLQELDGKTLTLRVETVTPEESEQAATYHFLVGTDVKTGEEYQLTVEEDFDD